MKKEKLIPNLTLYKKSIILHNIPLDIVKEQIKEYAGLYEDSVKKEYNFHMTTLPGNSEWVYVEFPYAEGITHYNNFWHYQNLMLWLSMKADMQFCLAFPDSQDSSLFLSQMDTSNSFGDTVIGIFEDRDFSFCVPGSIFKWISLPQTGFNGQEYLDKVFGFDMQLLSGLEECKWEDYKVILAFEED